MEKDEKKHKKTLPGAFKALGIQENVLQAIGKLGYKLPTPIQRKAIPIIHSGRDVIAMARTGSGKTAAFLIPLIEKLESHSNTVGVRGIVISPTRDLALQTFKFTKQLAKYTTLTIAAIVGGENMNEQFDALSKNPDILIATPGRLLHHLVETKMQLKRVEMIVFDEADQLFDLGFAAQLDAIIARLPSGNQQKAQTVLCSATLSSSVQEFLSKDGVVSRDNVEMVRLDVDQTLSPNLTTYFFVCHTEEKYGALLYLIQAVIPQNQQTIIFACTRYHVEFLTLLLEACNINCRSVYGSLDLVAQKQNISDFQQKKVSVLVVTDIAARGLDIPLLDNVIHFDFPARPKVFIHRSGRVARAGRSGCAYSILVREEIPYYVDLCRNVGVKPQFASSPSILRLLEEHSKNPNEPIPQKSPLSFSAAASAYVLGMLPATALSLTCDSYRHYLKGSVDMQSLQRSVANGFQMYRKQRPYAPHSSVKETKRLMTEISLAGDRALLKKSEKPVIDEDSDSENERMGQEDGQSDSEGMIKDEVDDLEMWRVDETSEALDEQWGITSAGLHPTFALQAEGTDGYSMIKAELEKEAILSSIHHFRPSQSALSVSSATALKKETKLGTKFVPIKTESRAGGITQKLSDSEKLVRRSVQLLEADKKLTRHVEDIRKQKKIKLDRMKKEMEEERLEREQLQLSKGSDMLRDEESDDERTKLPSNVKSVRTDFRDSTFFVPTSREERKSNFSSTNEDYSGFSWKLNEELLEINADERNKADRQKQDGKAFFRAGQKKWDRKKMKYVNDDGPGKNQLVEEARRQVLGNENVQNKRRELILKGQHKGMTKKQMDKERKKILRKEEKAMMGFGNRDGIKKGQKAYSRSMYEEWMRKTKRHIPLTGESEGKDVYERHVDRELQMVAEKAQKPRSNPNHRPKKKLKTKGQGKEKNHQNKVRNIQKQSQQRRPRSEVKSATDIAKRRVRQFSLNEHAKNVQRRKVKNEKASRK
ncbi:putative ATP-dependent RNA helicase DDX54 [Blattamonas nauphoetae]|uniref:ATP-dependent RNA helicase DDX54 n=1 Tax=Blattamonas nauphoetae TaxID=2049346 RepID=A0ABQ9XMB7_9EUKA|nr:putative ATP-dependent RNA helicase DDX54 [Blattamonas nauphoetae]